MSKNFKKDDLLVPLLCVMLVLIGVACCCARPPAWLTRLFAPPTLDSHTHWWYKWLNCVKTGSTSNYRIQMQSNVIYLNTENIQERTSPEEVQLLSDEIVEIPYTSLKFDKEIGRGAFGCVYKAQIAHNNATNVTVAVKILREEPDDLEKQDFEHEIEMMKACGKHVNVVRFLGVCKNPKLCIVMEYIPSGDLLSYLRSLRDIYVVRKQFYARSGSASYILPNGIEGSCETPPLTPDTVITTLTNSVTSSSNNHNNLERILDAKELLEFSIQIARGMRHLEERNLIHRDLAARNVLIDHTRTLKISDFGMSRQMEVYVIATDNPNKAHRKVPLRWLPPEAVTNGKYTSSSDVWSFGIVLWEIGTLGAFPYANLPNDRVLSYILTGGRLTVPPNCTPQLRELILRCWQLDPVQRPPFCQIVSELENMKLNSSGHSAYVDFSQVNPYYMLPPTQQL